MKYSNLTLVELKQIARDYSVKGFSGLNKDDLIALLKKKVKTTKKQSGGTNNMPRSHPLWRCDLCGKGSLDCECNNIGSFNNNNNNQYGGIKKTKKQ